MKDLDLPATTIPRDHLMCFIEGSDGYVDEQQPLDGRISIWGRVFLPHQNSVECNRG